MRSILLLELVNKNEPKSKQQGDLSHLTVLGILFNGDALLFVYACLVCSCCIMLRWLEKNKLYSLFWVLASLLFISCSKEKETPAEVLNDTIPANSIELFAGTFSSAAHPTSGSVRLVEAEGKWYLILENFFTDPGPDLKLYLASNLDAAQFVSLGKLKSTTGRQVYKVVGMPASETYPYVLVWCQQFSVLFGQAKLS